MNNYFPDEADLTDRMEQNLAEHACHLHRSMPGATVAETGDLLIADSGLDDDTFNIVAAARFTADDATADITDTIGTLTGTGRSFSWWVGPASTPADLTARLAAAGLPVSESETAMWAELDDTLPPPAVPGLDIRAVTTPEQLADYATVLAANWNPPAATVRGFFARAASQALAATCPARYLVATRKTVRSAPPRCSTTRESPASTTSPPWPPTADAASAEPSRSRRSARPAIETTASRSCKHRPTANPSTGAWGSAPAASSSNMPSTPDRQSPRAVRTSPLVLALALTGCGGSVT